MVNRFGRECPYRPIICQEGECKGCQIRQDYMDANRQILHSPMPTKTFISADLVEAANDALLAGYLFEQELGILRELIIKGGL